MSEKCRGHALRYSRSPERTNPPAALKGAGGTQPSCSIVTATSPFAERRTLLPSTSALGKLRNSVKWTVLRSYKLTIMVRPSPRIQSSILMSIFREGGFCLSFRASVNRCQRRSDRHGPTEIDFVTLPLIAYGAIRVRVTAANLEGEAEWTSLLGNHGLCRSCGL